MRSDAANSNVPSNSQQEQHPRYHSEHCSRVSVNWPGYRRFGCGHRQAIALIFQADGRKGHQFFNAGQGVNVLSRALLPILHSFPEPTLKVLDLLINVFARVLCRGLPLVLDSVPGKAHILGVGVIQQLPVVRHHPVDVLVLFRGRRDAPHPELCQVEATVDHPLDLALVEDGCDDAHDLATSVARALPELADMGLAASPHRLEPGRAGDVPFLVGLRALVDQLAGGVYYGNVVEHIAMLLQEQIELCLNVVCLLDDIRIASQILHVVPDVIDHLLGGRGNAAGNREMVKLEDPDGLPLERSVADSEPNDHQDGGDCRDADREHIAPLNELMHHSAPPWLK